YSAVSDTLANLTANTGGYVAVGINVTVMDAANLAQLATLATNNPGITLNATTIIDTVAGLTNSAYVKNGVNLFVTDAVTPAQLTTLAGMNTGGILGSTASISPPGTLAVAITMTDVYGSRWIGDNTFTTLPGNVSTAVPSPSFAFDWGGSNSKSSVTLGGASVAVNGNGTATSVASTGIQFGRYDSVLSITQANTGSFDGIFGNNRTGQWAYGLAGYLDSSTTLSLATNGTVTGTFGYVLDGVQSAPMDWDGNKGVLNSLTLTANFATNTLDTALKATMGATIWNASSTGVSLSTSSPTFYAGSNNFNVGQTSNITKGTTGPCTTCSWYLNGAFTGQNYAGAVVSFGLSDNSMNGNASGLDGVAALTRTGVVTNPTVTNATPPVASTNYVVATAGGNTGVNTQTVTNVTMNANNVLTGYGTSSTPTGGQWNSSTTINCTSCTGRLAADFAYTGIHLGTWDVGASANTWTKPVSGGQFHWITGPAAPTSLVESLIGIATYTLDGGTAPTAQTLTNGLASAAVTGTLSSASLAVDFNKQAVSLNFAVTAGGHNWVVSSADAPIGSSNGAGSSAFAASSWVTGPSALSVMLDRVAVTNTSTNGRGSYVSGQLTGAALNGALFQYELSATQAAVVVPTTLSATDGMVLQAPITVTGPIATGGSSTFAFTGAMVQLAATTTTLGTSFGAPTSLSTTGGVGMTASSFVPQVNGGSFDGIVSVAGANSTLGEIVQLNLLGAKVTSSGVGAGGLQYSDYGWWRKYPTMTTPFPATTTGTFTMDVFAGGYLLTPTAAMPTAITATYTGTAWAMAMDATSNYFLQGSSSLTANFTNGTLAGSLTGLTVTDANTNAALGSFNDLTLSGTISSASSGFTGTSLVAGAIPTLSPSLIALATGATTTGYSSGHFYGPNANEVTGAWGLASGALSVTGALGAANGTSINQTTQISVNGVAALNQTSAAINPATVSSRWALFTFTDPVKGLQANAANNNSSRVVVDGVGDVTAFDLGNNGSGGNQNVYTTAETIAIDANVTKNDTGADAVSGITWGRWTGGNLTVTDKVTPLAVTTIANTNTHWIAGPTTAGQVMLPVTGTFNYTWAGGTQPTDSLGNVGTLNSASLQANFTAQTVNMGVNATVNATNYVATGTNMPIQQGQFSNDNGGTYTATANGAAAQGFVGGVFTGATGNGAAVVYGFLNGATVVNGVAAFSRP
ncbi:MAG: transferrin-binding protein-like solute binding protein, partial [Pseudomonadota bacterium]